MVWGLEKVCRVCRSFGKLIEGSERNAVPGNLRYGLTPVEKGYAELGSIYRDVLGLSKREM